MLRPFGEPVETAPNGGFPYFNRGNGGNSEVFNEGPLFDLPNPFTITRNEAWTVSCFNFCSLKDYILCSLPLSPLHNNLYPSMIPGKDTVFH